MDLKDYLRGLREGWWLCAVGLLLGALIATVVTTLMTPMYVVNTRMFISTTSGATLSDAAQGSQFSQQRIASYQSYLTDQQVMSAVIADTGLDTAPDELASRITVDNPPGTLILDVSVTDPSPAAAVAIAESIDRQFPELVSRLETPEGSATSPVKVTITAEPELPSGPASPDPVRQVLIGLLLGFFLGAAVAVLRKRLDTRVRTTEQVASVASASTLGLVRTDQALADHKVLALHATSVAAEDFRRLRTNLDYVDVDSPPRVIVVSSPSAGEGKTTVAVNLAVTEAAAGRRVVLVEADLRRPRVTRYLGLPAGAGLSQVLAGVVDLEDVLQPSIDDRLTVLAAGPQPPNPGELLGSSAMASLVSKLRDKNDLVVIDSAPLLPVADTGSLTPVVDGLILCAQWGSTKEADLLHARQTVDRAGGRVLGVVLTLVPKSAVRDEGYGDEYLTEGPEKEQQRWGLWRRRRRPVSLPASGSPESLLPPAAARGGTGPLTYESDEAAPKPVSLLEPAADNAHPDGATGEDSPTGPGQDVTADVESSRSPVADRRPPEAATLQDRPESQSAGGDQDQDEEGATIQGSSIDVALPTKSGADAPPVQARVETHLGSPLDSGPISQIPSVAEQSGDGVQPVRSPVPERSRDTRVSEAARGATRRLATPSASVRKRPRPARGKQDRRS